MAASYTDLAGSHRDAPDAPPVGPVAPGQPIEVSIYLKDQSGDPLLDQPATARPAPAVATRASLRSRRLDDHAADFARIAAFASSNGLTVVGQDPARRLVTVAGTAAQLGAAFHTQLNEYAGAGGVFRARSGTLQLPTDIADCVTAVLGLDTRPVATPKLRALPSAAATSGFLPNAVARLYDFPVTKTHGGGECIGIIELGGGFSASDNTAAFAAMALAVPQVIAVGVSGGTNAPGVDTNADGEVALDIQVSGGAAPGAKIAVYFAPNTSQGFVDAISQAVHDEVNKPSVLSISWGSAESTWTQQAIDAMNATMKDAAQVGVTVLAASGDNLATDGQTDGAPHVDFPASSPYVLGCGGTFLAAAGGRLGSEHVWNNGDSGTGGGVSVKFPRPAYQSGAHVPAGSGTAPGRGVPDVAADADPNSGYRVVVDGTTGQIGGTSAVAPLWAGLVALINAEVGKPIGFAHPLLYGNPAAFHDITTGDNRAGTIGFAAGPGWDACTGLGTPIGTALLKAFTPA
ncbi:MAG: S53 family peptidase [Janthinobacterium lividum]